MKFKLRAVMAKAKIELNMRAAPFLFLSLFFVSCSQKEDSASFNSLNTFVNIKATGKNAGKACEEARQKILELEKQLSVTVETSEIFTLNQKKKASLSDQTFFLLQYALDFAAATEGAFNPCLFAISELWGFTTDSYRVPNQKEIAGLLEDCDFSKVLIDEAAGKVQLLPQMKIDLGGLGKGFCGDAAIEILRKNGIESAILDLGGNIQVLGKKADGREWRVGIKNPLGGEPVGVVRVSDKAVVTSGGYERFFTGEDGKKYIHIFNGKTGFPVESDLLSVTIICDKGIYADCLSTAMFVLGSEKAIEYWKNHDDFEMVLITFDKRIFFTDGLEQSLTFFEEGFKTEAVRKS